jgi:hypothetical protein
MSDIEAKEPDILDNYLQDVNKEKQNFELTPNEALPETETPEGFAVTDEELMHREALRTASFLPSKIVVETIDISFAGLLAWIFGAGTVEDFKTDQETKKALTEAWQNYLKDKGADLSPGMMLFMMSVGVYGPKIPIALDIRKANQKNKEISDKLEEIEKENANLKRKLKKQGNE